MPKKTNAKSGGNAVVRPQPSVKTGKKGPSARGATRKTGTGLKPSGKSGPSRMSLARSTHGSGGLKYPGVNYGNQGGVAGHSIGTRQIGTAGTYGT